MPMNLIGSGKPDDPLTQAAFGHVEVPKPAPKKAKAKAKPKKR